MILSFKHGDEYAEFLHDPSKGIVRGCSCRACENGRVIAANLRRIEKYKGHQCCVCGKWGANEAGCEPIGALIQFAQGARLTIKRPDVSGWHDKCLRQLKALLNWKRDAP